MLRQAGWSGGDLMSARSIGHTGFTGTGVWVDLESPSSDEIGTGVGGDVRENRT